MDAEINDLRALCDAKETELYKSHCEIEQLREEKRLRIDFKNMARELTERCDAQAQEIERLVEELKEHDGIVAVWRRRCTEADAEIERLRSDRRASVQQEDALIAEIERLRGLLRDVLLFDVFDYRDEKEMELLGRIREALGNE
jgi:chromosome segregation ATPase